MPAIERHGARAKRGSGLRMACAGLVLTLVYAAASASNTEKPTLPVGCNESVCGSVVSKCLLTQSCKCGPNPVKNNITCARDCFYCLDHLYPDCCSCVDVCRKDTLESFSLSLKSNVEDLPEPIPELFQMLVESADASQGRWRSISFPAQHSIIGLNKDIHFVRIAPYPVGQNGSIDSTPPPMAIHPTYDTNSNGDDINCTVAFMKSCLSLNKCRDNCMSLGAASYRWFHDGCCECVGSTCLNYGLPEGRCDFCPLNTELLGHPDENAIDIGSHLDEEIVIQDPEYRSISPIEVAVSEAPAPVDASTAPLDDHQTSTGRESVSRVTASPADATPDLVLFGDNSIEAGQLHHRTTDSSIQRPVAH